MRNTLSSISSKNDRRGALAGWVAGAACLLAGSAAMATPVYNPSHLPSGEIDRVGQICSNLVGLPRSAASPYYACEESLSESVTQLPAGAAAAAAPLPSVPVGLYSNASNGEAHRREQNACAAIGFTPQTRGAAACVADLDSRLFQADNPVLQ